MKKIIYLSALFFAFATQIACSPDQGDEDYLSNRTPSAYFNASSGILYVEEGVESSFDVKIALTAPQSSDLTYTVEVDPSSTAVDGLDYTIASSSNVIPKGNVLSSIKVVGNFEQATLEGKQVVFNLVAVEGAEVKWRTKFTLTIFKLCPFESLSTLSYSAQVFAFGDEAPGYTVDLVPVPGTTNQWQISSAWGPTFVGWATGNAAFNNQYLYSGTIILNDDFTIVVDGNDAWATGGTGVFSPCTQTFSYTLDQGLFTTAFTTDVVLTPN